MESQKRIILGVTGASGVVYAKRALQALKAAHVETHLVMSRAAEMTITYELGEKPSTLSEDATYRYSINDIGAAIASGSFETDGMLIVPCSVKTMSEIAAGTTSTLLTRAADVVLKERRPLVLAVRETPFHLGHLRTMTQLSEMGAVIAPPLPAFYANPQSLDEMIDQSVGRLLDQLKIKTDLVKRWGTDIKRGGNATKPQG